MNQTYKLENGKAITLRPETKSDYFEVESITREAFWNESTDENPAGCNEHLLAYKLRGCKAFIKELDFVAELDGKVIGNIMYTKGCIQAANGEKFTAILFGPLSVLPEFQKQGVGSALVKHTLNIAAEMNFGAVIIFGHPEYYHRFGFCNAERFKITTKDGKNFEPFMALELLPGYLSDKAGKFYEDDIYENLPEAEVKEFDKKFNNK